MSEKRFTFDREVEFEIYDNVTKKHYDGRVGCQEKICQLLNELNDENEKLRNIHLSIDLTYSYGYGRYLADVRVIDDE